MKKNLFIFLMMSCAMTMSAFESDVASAGVADDETTLDIIKKKTKDRNANENVANLLNIWGKTKYLNISLNNTTLSSDELPSCNGPISNKFKRDLGLGLQMGKTFNFNKQPIGSVLFLGLDYTWLDFNYNSYKATVWNPSETPTSDIDQTLPADDFVVYDNNGCYMPWHNKKMTFDYGMSLGPSITLYPFTTLGNSASSKIRLNLFFHIGYGIGLSMIKDVVGRKNTSSTEKAFGHGLFTSFGGSLTWDFVGIGFDVRNDSNLKYKHINNDFNNGTIKFKQKTTRIYLQFRF